MDRLPAGNPGAMPDLLRLPLRAAELALAPTRFAVKTIWGLLYPHDDYDAPAAPEPAPRPEPPQTRPPRPRAKPKPSPKAARRAVRHEPTRGEAAAMRQRQRMEEQEAGGPGPGPEVDVAEPWEGYAAMSEEQVLDRLTGADEALRLAVRLYESFNADRQQVLYATEEPVAQP
ncbi:MAG: hypothetical protein QOF12_202 [Solirubrobacteraceae bacterium]|nr:hypothetical protein [Solirubrobacteraceae bacterium]